MARGRVPEIVERMQIAVATLLFGDIAYARYTEAINRHYCRGHGYRYKILHPASQVERSPLWHKVSGVANLLPESDYVLFLDADAYFLSTAGPIEELIADHMGEAAMLLGTDRRNKSFAWSDTDANCGVFLVRNCPQAFEILSEWWDSPTRYDKRWLWKWPPEQGAFNLHVRSGRLGEWIRTIEYAYMNGMDGSFIRHLAGLTDEQRLVILRTETTLRSLPV